MLKFNFSAWIEESQIKPYLKFRDKLKKSGKTAAFKDAVAAIEEYIDNPDVSLFIGKTNLETNYFCLFRSSMLGSILLHHPHQTLTLILTNCAKVTASMRSRVLTAILQVQLHHQLQLLLQRAPKSQR